MSSEAKQLRIKVGVVKRTRKEYEAYQKEEASQRASIAKMEVLTYSKYFFNQYV